ncbi:MAG: copper amine oxidase N-terminal domain-containing protein [Clostridiales bacterium]|nr:copper amine oxidase N-terminal domain-containing protein [Clostridiales bacterium]
MKKAVFLCGVLFFAMGLFTAVSFGAEDIKVICDGRELIFDAEPDITDGVAYVPIRPVLEAFTRDEVDYKSGRSGRILTAYTDEGKFSLDVDKGNYMYLDKYSNYNKIGILNHKPYIKNGRTMLPVREIIEILDGIVEYDGEDGLISIHSQLYESFTDLEGLPYPIVLLNTGYNVEISSALTSDEGFEYYKELAEKILAYEEEAEIPEEHYDYLKEFCYYEIKYLEQCCMSEEYERYEEFLPVIINSYFKTDFSDYITIDSSLSTEESLKNLFEYLCGGETEGVATNSLAEPYVRYALSYIDSYYLSYYDNIDLGEYISEYLNGYSFLNYSWPVSTYSHAKLSGTISTHIELYFERFYRYYPELTTSYLDLIIEYAPDKESDLSDDERLKEMYKSYFGDDWVYYYYGSDVIQASYIH